MGGGGGGATQRSFGAEWPSIKSFETGQFQQLGKYVQGQPLLQMAQNLSLASGQSLMDWILPILQGGGMSPQTTRQGQQDARAAFAARGNVGGNQAIAGEILGTQAAREQQYGWAQGIATGGLNQLLGTQQTEVGTFAQLVDPVLQYLSTLFAGNQQVAAQQALANQSKNAGIGGGAISAVSSIAPALIGLSDKRLKEKIRDTGVKTPEGIPIKTFQWKGDTRRQVGVIAQDVEKKVPGAVVTHPSGLKMVNFASITAPHFQLSEA